MTDLHDQITGKIIEQLEQGTAPWRKPWDSTNDTPFTIPLNKTTGKYYRGINIPLLWLASAEKEYTNHNWGSFKQWAEKKEFVRKGEKATTIVYYDTIERKKDDKVEKIPFLKMSFVFNQCQLQSYNPDLEIKPDRLDLVTRVENADEFIKNTQADIRHGGSRACYWMAEDYIQMPPTVSFNGTQTQTPTEGYYSTVLHELSHWTGHEKRCDRQFGKRFGDSAYAFEELVAEMSSAFLCAELDITDAPQPDHASYIGHWLTMLKDDKKAILTAASAASKAGDCLKAFQSNALYPGPALIESSRGISPS
ncbi:ArdC family protein [Dyadobacter sp. CY356]|uniref:ArdC family protein n=1 Tax=Dyadobacter sp. CY356 TaxID=2906442 RepID=UPI001EEBC032|nr:zincin-like metallopeptidase domain-containing protein [Dyadobacter sp. CY356]MCF0055557.1 ssDNA-binding domain-containing protein [Dyadobacter sp. CY356]